MNLQRTELGALAPDFVLLNYLRISNQEFARQLMEAGIKVGVLDTEGGVLENPEAYATTKAMATDQNIRHRVSGFCSWGTKLAEHAKWQGWYRNEQVVVTGAPRFDFYVQPWRQAALQVSEYAEAYSKPLVLINGSFSVANPRFRTPEQEIQLLVERLGQDRSSTLEFQRVQHQSMIGMAHLANHLAAKSPHATFIYRPHPFEKLETYQELLETRENLHLVKTGTVDGWILRANAVIQRSCTTAIEASMAGVPALSPSWIPTPQMMETVEAVSIQCSSPAELEDYLKSCMNGHSKQANGNRSALKQVIDDWFYAIDGLAHQRVASAILTHARNESLGRVRLEKCRDILYGLDQPETPIKAKVASAMRRRLGLPVSWSLHRWRDVTDMSWDRSEKYFDAENVQVLVDAIWSCQKLVDSMPCANVAVTPAHEHGDYHFDHSTGRSVTIRPL
jgi:surface carbohydrate biosynthesis protein